MTAPTADPKVAPIPEGFHTITPSLTFNDAAGAIEFYKTAFGATEIDRALGPDGVKIMHATIQIGNSRLMLNDAFPEMGAPGPFVVGGGSVTLHLYVEDADAVFAQAVAAGATPLMPIVDGFWGDRYGQFKDPYGFEWSIATHVRDVTEAEIAAAMAKMSEMGCGPEASS